MEKKLHILCISLVVALCAQAQCINMTNLNDPSITCTYGTVENPYASAGVVDYGSSSGASRHTVHTSIMEHDYIIPDLYTIPRGESSSIRLGNWSIGGEAESITFEYTVSASNPLLLLKYAGVMENPGHSPSEQPRLKLDVMDAQGNLIDSLCNCFDFIAASNLGWNTYYGTLWKDWTNIGVNLISYIGQKVRIRLTSYDCSQMGHFGYSYIHLSCVQQEIQNTACGDDVVMEAPLGYDYKWYIISGGTKKTIGSGREIVVPRDGTLYYCDCSQIGKPLCYFTISRTAEANPRYPIADFSIFQKLGCADTLYITNTSGISINGVDKNVPNTPCDSAVWVLDDGRQFTQYDISSIPIVFAHSGQHTITLTSFLTKGKCHSSKTMTVNVHGYTDPHSSSMTAEICEGSYYYFNGHRLTKDSTYTFIVPTSYNCDSTINLRLIVHPVYNETDTIYLCDGESIDYHGQRITSNGTFYARFKTIHGCDSIFKAIVYRKNSFYIEKDTAICKGDIFNFSGRLLQNPGIYWDSAKTEFGCDSITKLTLRVKPSYIIPTYVEVCHNQTFLFRGREVKEPGIYYDTLISHLGCDSIYELVFNKIPIYLFQDTVTICEGSFYNFRGRNVSEAGFYYDSLKTVSGCDSIYQLLLVVKPISRQKIDTVLCGGVYDFRGRPLTQSGIYYDTVKTAYGCDSVYELELTVHPTYLYKDYIEQCEGDAFEFRGKLVTKQGVYYDSLFTRDGCDSVYQLVYNITPNYLQEYHDSICSNKVYTFRGMSLTRPGIYYDTLQTASGCDSVFKLTLQHLPSYNFFTSQIIDACSGSMDFNGRPITQSGTYYDSLQTTCGCDSIFTLSVIIHDAYLFEEKVHSCSHEPYIFRGREITQTGIYEDSLITIDGCDSIYRLDIEITPTIRDTIVDTLCVDEKYIFRGMTLTQPGFYSDTLTDPMGYQCAIHSIALGQKASSTISQLQIPQICANDSLYEIIVHYYGARPYTYSIYYDNNALKKGFVNITDKPFEDTIYAPIPQYKNDGYLRPDYYHARVELQNGFCDPSKTAYTYDILIRYPSRIIRQHWNDVVAVLNETYNGGYSFMKYEWEVNGRMITTTDVGYSNLYMPELRIGDHVCAYLTRAGESYAIPTCPIVIQDVASHIIGESPIIINPTLMSKAHPITHIMTEADVSYYICDVHGSIIQSGNISKGIYQQIQLPSVSGIYLMYIIADQIKYATKILVQ